VNLPRVRFDPKHRLFVAHAVLNARPLIAETTRSLTEVHQRLARAAAEVEAQRVRYEWQPTPTGIATQLTFDVYGQRGLRAVILDGKVTHGHVTTYRGTIRRDWTVLTVLVSAILLVAAVVVLISGPVAIVLRQRIDLLPTALFWSTVLVALSYYNLYCLLDGVDTHVRLLQRVFDEQVRWEAESPGSG
jgi:hypothetical protein